MVHLHNEILHSRQKTGAPTLWDNVDGTGEHYAKWNKLGGERQIPYDLTFEYVYRVVIAFKMGIRETNLHQILH